jgi:hypothetical protein
MPAAPPLRVRPALVKLFEINLNWELASFIQPLLRLRFIAREASVLALVWDAALA